MKEKENNSKRDDDVPTFPASDAWQHPGEIAEDDLKFDHALYRKAKQFAIGAGTIAGIGVAIGHTEAPWWMPILTFAVVAAIVYRILRPRFRHPSIEDEI